MMKKAYRAIGQIEGVALLQGETLRDLLMGAVDVLEDAMKAQEAKVAALDKTATEQTELVDYLLRQKDELLTENARLREMLEKLEMRIEKEATKRNNPHRFAEPPSKGERGSDGPCGRAL